MLTTSRYPSRETREGAKRLAASLGTGYHARGRKTIGELAGLARRTGEREILVVEERAGRPFLVALIEVNSAGGWRWAGKAGFDGYAGKREHRGRV